MTWTPSEERALHPPDKPYCATYPQPTPQLRAHYENYLNARDLSVQTADRNRWFPSSEVDGWGRIVVPALSHQPGNLYWQARVIHPLCGPRSLREATVSEERPFAPPRRWESPYGCSRGDAVCVVWPEARSYSDILEAVVVEGPMDALAAAGTGRLGLALMGVAPPKAVLALTAELLRGILTYVVMDMGAEKPMLEVSRWLKERGIHALAVHPYPHKDLAAMPHAKRVEILLGLRSR